MGHRYFGSTVIGFVVGTLVALILTFNAYPFELQPTPYQAMSIFASGASEFGVVGAVPSLSSDSSKQAAIDKISGAGFGWMRHEFTYANPVDFTPYDAANSKAKAAGIKTLALLAYPGADKSHDEWKAFVTSVVGHYGADVAAWEIMNEADNYLSASDYVTYLQEARDIIKGINSGAKIVATGITSRQQATSFWDGIASAGGWGMFDAIGLHVYHSGNPEKVNFGGGDLVGELDRVVGNINKNGGGKTIWITEMGYRSTSEGEQGQANYLARALLMSRSVSSVERIFIYRLWDGDAYGLLTSSLAEKPSYGRVKSVIENISGKGSGSKLSPQTKSTLDNFDAVSSKWDTTPTSNGSTALSTTTGYSGNGMKISYNFTADAAYAVAEQNIPISGTPSAIAVWINGDNTINVWKFRFKDKNGETFQTDLGSIASGWSYKQFSIGTDTAFTSWGGDGNIDFPIAFNAIVIDRQGGAASASGVVDELVAITGSADLYAYLFGSTVAWWKASGTDTATLCGSSREFREDPQYAGNVNCGDTPTATTAQGASSTTAKKKSTTTTKTVVAKVAIDKTKSYIRLDGQNVIADDKSTFRMVVGLRSADDKAITDRKPEILMSGGQSTLRDSILVGPEWITEVSSNQPGQRIATIKADGVDLGELKMEFVAATPGAAAEVPTIVQPVEAVPLSGFSTAQKVAIGGVSLLALVGALMVWRRTMLVEFFHQLHNKISS